MSDTAFRSVFNSGDGVGYPTMDPATEHLIVDAALVAGSTLCAIPHPTTATYVARAALSSAVQLKAAAGTLWDGQCWLAAAAVASYYVQLHNIVGGGAAGDASRVMTLGKITPGTAISFDLGGIVCSAGIRLALSSTDVTYTAAAVNVLEASGWVS